MDSGMGPDHRWNPDWRPVRPKAETKESPAAPGPGWTAVAVAVALPTRGALRSDFRPRRQSPTGSVGVKAEPAVAGGSSRSNPAQAPRRAVPESPAKPAVASLTEPAGNSPVRRDRAAPAETRASTNPPSAPGSRARRHWLRPATAMREESPARASRRIPDGPVVKTTADFPTNSPGKPAVEERGESLAPTAPARSAWAGARLPPLAEGSQSWECARPRFRPDLHRPPRFPLRRKRIRLRRRDVGDSI